jgi:hypothetical protein
MLLHGTQQSHLQLPKATAKILHCGDIAVHQGQIPQFRETILDDLRVEGGIGPLAESEFSDLFPETRWSCLAV